MHKFYCLVVLVVISSTTTPTAVNAAEDIETPTFEVTLSGEFAELRRYSPMIVAEARVIADDIDDAGSLGFMPLANYIFGNNSPGEKIESTAPVASDPVMDHEGLKGGDGDKIAMTAPVTTAPDQDGQYTVRFMMPSKWTMETLPAPIDKRVTLTNVPERFMVVSGFTGPKLKTSIDATKKVISDFVESNSLSPVGDYLLAGYSAPRVPDEQKKWEVHLMVKPPH